MFELKVENIMGDVITLTQNESAYQVINIEGLNPPNAMINSSPVVGRDGSRFQSSKLEDRNLVITVKINGDVEKNRINLYRYFKSKRWHKIYYKNGSRDVYIEGYVESIENNLFTDNQTMQISIVCHDPYFKSMEEIVTDISQVLASFEFPFAISDPIPFSVLVKDRIINIVNDGEADTGLMIFVRATGTVPDLRIFNDLTGEFFGFDQEMIAGDQIVINTNRGEKSITLTRDGVDHNVISGVSRNSTWLTLAMGDNQFTYGTESGRGEEFLEINFRHRTIYEGV
ncbi:MAG: phage tail family protein [Bacteroidales bacterium]|nr:phage tail family protein [Bacteroidales bacterium]